MSKAIIVPDLKYTSPKGRRGGNSSGRKELLAKLKYFQYRDDHDGHIPQDRGDERWTDRGLGQNYHDILTNCERFSSDKVLAWTWVVSPAPDLMACVPDDQRKKLVTDLTEQIVEAYYTARGVDVPEFSYALHDRLTTEKEDGIAGLQHLHTHLVIAGTVPTLEGAREPFYNHKKKGDVELLHNISTEKLEAALDRYASPEWRKLRPDPEIQVQPEISQSVPDIAAESLPDDLDFWFPRDRDISGL